MIRTVMSLRRAFWAAHPTVSARRIRSYSGRGQMYTADARVAFTDYVDCLAREGVISDALAFRATLSPGEDK